MIDSSVPPTAGGPAAPVPYGLPPLPVRPAVGRLFVLATVFVCAACGLVYELELVALASYLIGDSVTQASVVLSVMVFAMGLGSLLAKRLRNCPAFGFGLVESALALVGGGSAMALYAAFTWFGASRSALVGFSLGIGILIGAEVPLLMTLIQRVRRQDAAGAVADLFAADYVGALVGGLAFPFLLLPRLGQLTGALVTGAVNAVAGGALVLWLFRYDLRRRTRWILVAVNALVLALLAAGTLLADDFERAARRAVYGDDVRVARQSGVQEIVLTGSPSGPVNLYLDGRLRVSGRDEYRYHEALVHPAMAGPHTRVLVLGGGDGLAAREVLRYSGVRAVTVVELDPAVVRLARTDPALRTLNGGALDDPRLRVVTADAFQWLRTAVEAGAEANGDAGAGRGGGWRGAYDVIVADLPDPGVTASMKLYSEEFYGMAARALAPGGRLVVHAGAASTRPRVFWTVESSMAAAGLRTLPYRATGRTAGFPAGPDRTNDRSAGTPQDWGFLLATVGGHGPRLALDQDVPRLHSLTRRSLLAGVRAVEHDRVGGLPPSTLVHPRYAD